MSDTEAIEIAQRRLLLALEALEAATERRHDADRQGQALVNQVHVLDSDRARLAGELDETTARARALENASKEVGQRIDQAIETIRAVLESGDRGAGD